MGSSYQCEQCCFDRVLLGGGYEQHVDVCGKVFIHAHTELTL